MSPPPILKVLARAKTLKSDSYRVSETASSWNQSSSRPPYRNFAYQLALEHAQNSLAITNTIPVRFGS